MSSIDEIKRQCELARSLRERGLARDSLDAAEQARSAVSSDPAVVAKRAQDAMQERLALLERKLEQQTRAVDDVRKDLAARDTLVRELQSKVSSLSAQLRDVESAQQAAAASPPAWVQQLAQQPVQPSAPQWSPQNAPQVQASPAPQQMYAQQQPMPQQWQSSPQTQPTWQAPPVQQVQSPAPQTWNQPYPPQMRGGDKPVETRPIDRNNVAPSDISVEKFFYFGNKR